VKPLMVTHWGTTPGQNFIYVHLNRVINKYDLDMFYIAGPGHGGPAIVGNVYLEGTWSEVYPNVTQDEAGLKELSSAAAARAMRAWSLRSLYADNTFMVYGDAAAVCVSMTGAVRGLGAPTAAA